MLKNFKNRGSIDQHYDLRQRIVQVDTPRHISLSVIMPALNPDYRCAKAVKSVLVALPSDAELIVFAEGDLSGKYALDEINDARLIVLENPKKPGGISAALNILIKEARGDLIARMDSDDLCLPWRFTRQMNAIKISGADFIFSNAVLFGSGVRPLGFMPQVPLGLNNESSRRLIGFLNPFVHPTMMARKDALQDLGGYSDGFSEDYDLWLRAVLAQKKMQRLRGYDILYRVHTEQLSRKNSMGGVPAETQKIADMKTLVRRKVNGFNVANQSETSALAKALPIDKVPLSVWLYFSVLKPFTSLIARLTVKGY
jgi:cellulose synthase/poly-beta-1,6-N-acetylglucosamine synthase-like glycosyltransferase